jgi:hypothetical protein
MTAVAFRLRLAIALGLPLAPACKSPPEPIAPTASSPTTATTNPSGTTTSSPPAAGAGPAGRCARDEIDERVCGLISTDYQGSGGLLPAPYEHCTQNGLALWNLEPNHVLDGWRLQSHDKELASFHFDAAATASFKYEGTYSPESPRCCYQRCNPLRALANPRRALPAGMKEYELCVPTPVGTKFPAANAKQCPAALRTRHVFPEGTIDAFDDAPFSRATEGECCYSVASKRPCPPNTFIAADGCRSPHP